MLVAALLLGPSAFQIGQDSPLVGDGGELPLPSVAFGLIAFGILMALLAITFAFRSIGKRH
ncbi:hypothetical protein [Quadrisphaera sp. DSM 44207]|uniref:hypothetical protein n=1 Tax=Quadrisphaera sp. DSM 44207 TaxID=1881057 RepID=UPI0008852AA6|nr:hypothetical protein [Quadrisphaera sp. DSM 44207]SDQ05322.1 hypothetical protein SAMN05428996_0218 [Quadrisphaera sp. DSM 44207]